MEERLRFVARLLDGEKMAGLCREFGISNKTTYRNRLKAAITETTKKGAKIKMMGSKTNLNWEKLDEGFKIIIPEKMRTNPTSKYAWVFRISKVK